MIAAAVVFAYLALVMYVGIFAFRGNSKKAEDFFVANRSLGTFVFLLSLFGSNMTSFAILGSSGLAFRQGVGVYGLMASISGLVIASSLFLVGTRIWAIGKKFGHMTQVQIFRDRWEMGHIGTVIFALQALMLVPYIIIGVMGGGETLEGVSGGRVPYWLGGGVVALVVMGYVFFGGMRGTAWVNAMQTSMFLVVGTVAFVVIARGMGGFGNTVAAMEQTLAAAAPEQAPRTDGALLTRLRIPLGYYASYALIPLSSIMFPHIAIFCLTAKRMSSFRKTVVFYPLCILAIWAPAVFLGAVATSRPAVVAQMAAASEPVKAWVRQASAGEAAGTPTKLEALLRASASPEAARVLDDVRSGRVERSHDLGGRLALVDDPAVRAELRQLALANQDGVMLALLDRYSPALLAGLLGAAIMACVMASDSQILALSTMWSQDVFRFYGHTGRLGEAAQIWSARAFVVLLTVVAYAIAVSVHQYASIFEIAIQYAFAGYASMAPIMLAALFWRRSTKWGALAATLWIAACLAGNIAVQAATTYSGPPGGAVPVWSVGDVPVLMREATRVSFTEWRMLLVVPMFAGSALLMWAVSLLTPAPSRETIDRYFPAAPAGPVRTAPREGLAPPVAVAARGA